MLQRNINLVCIEGFIGTQVSLKCGGLNCLVLNFGGFDTFRFLRSEKGYYIVRYLLFNIMYLQMWNYIPTLFYVN